MQAHRELAESLQGFSKPGNQKSARIPRKPMMSSNDFEPFAPKAPSENTGNILTDVTLRPLQEAYNKFRVRTRIAVGT